ncbi:ABC transporter substrate-binding protein [Amycolatopsis sp. YIM 10]|uniref:ABC transporter substrate-binding protein n=1 Tax=Amycolatopsis sp. YIM 10 TaxID=2653857 RepID=UPI00128FE351|nr:ABC transporter substrate-binding protein [Amycolatopsis sp. YIM 10]QFU86053.1 putative siderophore-binding lipoprotein YfiY precursor [Amycolatopsis sp. YIM 10]
MLKRSFALVALVVLTLAGCASDPEPAAEGDAAFSATVKHAFGETTFTKKPQRVVALGYNDLAVATAMGLNVVGAVKGYDPGVPQAPYLSKQLGPEVLTLDMNGISFEQVAAYRPDVILAVSMVTLDAPGYEKLSRIAPTLPFETTLYGGSMQDDALRIGRAVGDEAGAQRLVDAAAAEITKLKADLPGLAGKSYLFGQARGEVLPLVVGKDNQTTKFMNSLGLKIPDAFANAEATAELAPGTIGLSYEQVEQLDSADALFMTYPSAVDKTTFESNSLVQRLKVVGEGRFQAVTSDTAQALQAPNVAAVKWLLDQLRPTLTRIGQV